jgi:hypothetical protein
MRVITEIVCFRKTQIFKLDLVQMNLWPVWQMKSSAVQLLSSSFELFEANVAVVAYRVLTFFYV